MANSTLAAAVITGRPSPSPSPTTRTALRLVYLPRTQGQSPRIFAFALGGEGGNDSGSDSVSMGSHPDCHVCVTTMGVGPHQCRISSNCQSTSIHIKNTGQSLFHVNNSPVAPDSPPLQLSTGDLIVLGADKDRTFRVEIVYPATNPATVASPTAGDVSRPTTPPDHAHTRLLPLGITATPASIRGPRQLPRTPSTAPSLSSALVPSTRRRMSRPSLCLTQPRPGPPSSTKSVKWGPPLRPQLFLASDPPASPVSRGATPPIRVDSASSSPGISSAGTCNVSSPLAGRTPRSILKRTAAAVSAAVKIHKARALHLSAPSSAAAPALLLSPKSTGPLRGTSFKFSAPLTVPAATLARPKRPMAATPVVDQDESELSDLPSSPSPAASGFADTGNATPTKTSNRSSLSSHLPATAPELCVSPTTVGQQPDTRSPLPPRKAVELVMVSDSESDMSMVSTAGDTTSDMLANDACVTSHGALTRPLTDSNNVVSAKENDSPPQPAILATFPELVSGSPGTSPVGKSPRPTRSPAAPVYVRPATARVTAAARVPDVQPGTPYRAAKRTRAQVEDDDGAQDEEDVGAASTPSKRKRARRHGPGTGAGAAERDVGNMDEKVAELRRSTRLRTPVKRVGTF